MRYRLLRCAFHLQTGSNTLITASNGQQSLDGAIHASRHRRQLSSFLESHLPQWQRKRAAFF
jgi:hypothetical protein